MVGYWLDKRYKNVEYKSYRLRKRFFDRLVSKFKKNNQTVVIGNYSNIRGMKYGKKLPPLKYFKDCCRRNGVTVKELDEFNSSKLCSHCGDVLRNYDAETNQAEVYVNARQSKFSKLKYCEKCQHIINRDVNASINIGRKNTRPDIFECSKDKFNK